VSPELAVGCEPEKVTALVDGALDARDAAALEAHLALCGACRALAQAERAVRQRLHSLPAPDLPPGLETRLRARLEAPRRFGPARLWPVALPVAASLALVLWARGLAPVVAWELAHDHAHCFAFASPPAQVRSAEPAVVLGWFAGHGTPVPALPDVLAEARLFGARYCRLADNSSVPHVFYTGGPRPLSLFVLAHAARFEDGYTTDWDGRTVALVLFEGRAVGVVGERSEDVAAALRRLRADPATRQAVLRLVAAAPGL
jgi:hypothetical protein